LEAPHIINSIPQEVVDASRIMRSDVKLSQEGHVSRIGSGSHGDVYRLFDRYACQVLFWKSC